MREITLADTGNSSFVLDAECIPLALRGRGLLHSLKPCANHPANSGPRIVRHILYERAQAEAGKMAKQLSIAAMLTILVCLVTLTRQPVHG